MDHLSFVFADKATVPGYIGTDVQAEVLSHILEVKPDKILLICDSGAYAHHPDYFLPLFHDSGAAAPGESGYDEQAPEVHEYMLPGGDVAKSWDNLSNLMKFAFEVGTTKRSLIVAFGGGALLNIAGLFASMLFRGSKLIYVPTTFLAMHNVVTSLKTSICFDGVKNNIGSFYAPLKILIDIGFCRTLPRKELLSGLGVLAKNALLLGGEHAEEFIVALSKEQVDAAHGSSGEELVMDEHTLMKLTALGIDAKMKKLASDACESSIGTIFEYGHTVSHAIEKAYGDSVIPHGLAVTYGMLSNSYAAERMGIMSAEDRKSHDSLCWSLLKRWRLPEPRPSIEKVMGFAMRDSRRGITAEADEEISDVILRRIGEPVSTKTSNLSKFPCEYVSKWLYSMGFTYADSLEAQSLHHVADLTNGVCKDLLNTIRTTPDADLVAKGFEPLTVGFANHVWGTQTCCHALVVKSYTEAAFVRLDAEAIGCVDVLCGSHGIGPPVFFSSPQGLVTERLHGRTLEESDMHKEKFDLLENVAKVLAELHRLPVPAQCEGDPMLWRTMNKMLEAAARKPELWAEGVPGLDAISLEANKAQMAVEMGEFPIVLCHGDLKPSNVFLAKLGPSPLLGGLASDIWDGILRFKGDKIFFIDHELGGPNYRAFDLMKLFRTADKSSDSSMDHFLSAYARNMQQDLADIRKETKLFECLTWLEAVCFFLAMPQFKPNETSRWNALALDRWKKYEATKDALVGEDAWRACIARLG